MKEVNRILVAIDRSAMAEEALKRAVSIAKEKEAQLVVMHVIEPSFIESPFGQAIDEDEIKKTITEEVDRVTGKVGLEYILFVESGSASSSIALKVQSIHADLLIVGTHGKNDISSNYFGSTTLKLIQKTRIPVLVVKNEVRHQYKKMFAPTNLSDYSKESIVFARMLINTASLKYLHAYITVDELMAQTYRISTDQQSQFKKELLTEATLALEKFVEETGEGGMALVGYTASINEDLLAYIKKDDADLLVLGSKGVNNLNSFLFGSTASYLVQNSPTDVLVYVPVLKKPKTEIDIKPKIEAIKKKDPGSPVQKDLDSRKEEIMDNLETFFEENLKYTNWNVPEAPDQEIAESLIAIFAERLNEIKQKVKEGKYQEKRSDIFQ